MSITYRFMAPRKYQFNPDQLTITPVRKRQRVERGSVIGQVGNTGH